MTVVWHHEHKLHERHVAPNRLPMFWLIVFAVFILFSAGVSGWFFWGGWRGGVLPVFAERMLFVPVGYVDGRILWYPSIARLAHGIAASDGRSDVVERDYLQSVDAIVRNNALETIAKNENVMVSDSDISADIQWTDDIRSFESLAGWSDDEYFTFVGKPFTLSKAVEDSVLRNEEYHFETRARMRKVLSKLELGIAFEDIANEYSEDPVTAQAKGSFGYVLPAEVDAAFVDVFLLPPNVNSSVIITNDFYWIFRIEDSVTDESGTRTLLRGIAIKKEMLVRILDKKVSEIIPLLWVR